METLKNNNSKGVNPLDIDTWTKNCRVKLTTVGGFILMLTEGRSGNMGKNNGKVPGELNFNPYVIIPSIGEKKYYQRSYCWTLEGHQPATLKMSQFPQHILYESTDEDVLKVFLNVNFSGKPMSKEHIKFVQDIYNKLGK